MRIDKKSFILIEVILFMLVIVLLVRVGISNRNAQTKRIFVVMDNSEESSRNAFRYGLKMAARDSDVDVVIVSTGELETPEDELALIARETENGANGFIIEPVSGNDITNKIKEITEDIPVVFVNNDATKDGSGEVSVIKVDNYQIGYDLGESIARDYSGKIENKTFGILINKKDVESAYNREKGCVEAIKKYGGIISWTSTDDDFSIAEFNDIIDLPKVDIIVALDDKSVTVAGEMSLANNLNGAVIYGIGNSTESIYYLENNNVECLLIPDDFKIGYQSFTEIANKIQNFYKKTESFTIPYTELRRKNVFDEENQRLLYTMSQ